MKKIGYKVMPFNDDGLTVKAGANSRLNYTLEDLEVGKEIKMPGNGIYIGINKKYVLDYYSELAEKELLLTFEFDINDIITGNINDREPELSLSSVTILNTNIIIDGEIQKKELKKKNRLKPNNHM